MFHNVNLLLTFSAALISGGLALTSLLGQRRTATKWGFFAGMTALAAQSVFDGLSLAADDPLDAARWQTLALGAKSCLPVAWIYFSLVYSRGNYREFLRRWRLSLLAAALLPVGWAALFLTGQTLVSVEMPPEPGRLWQIIHSGEARVLVTGLLLAGVLILANLEKTFRSAVGAMQWRIKFMVLGLGVIFAVRVYTQSQALLFSRRDLAMLAVDASALLSGCALIGLSYLRHGMGEIDIYPSRVVLQSSLTVLLVGGYLFIVGVLAQIAAHLGGTHDFQAQALVVLLGIVVLAVLLSSDRLRQQINRFVSRHFERPQHDFRDVWTRLTRCMYEARDEASLCEAVAALVSETFRALSVSLWVADEGRRLLCLGASTSPQTRAAAAALPETGLPAASFVDGADADGATARGRPLDLDKLPADWAEKLRDANPRQFAASGQRLCVPLAIGERRMGFAVLADRVNSVPFTTEELDLLKCIGDQVAAGLLNLRLTGDLMQAKELEAFQTMSTFFVHDLKNAASSLGLMLENLPVHFDDPEFRADALRGIGNTTGRINHLVERLGTLRQRPDPRPASLDLNQLINETVDALPGPPPGVEMHLDLRPLPRVLADREQLQSVLTNLVINAREALERGGCVRVETSQHQGQAVLVVTDNGGGMSAEFMRHSLFRPFHSTKKRGLGIGMFQSKMMIEANRGSLHVESEVGKGTRFRITLPLAATL